MAKLDISPLTHRFGVEVSGINLSDLTADHLYPDVREAFETHSALLFREQTLDPETHIRLAQLFGPIEDRQSDERGPDEAFTVPQVSNVRGDGSITNEMDLHTLNLRSNQLWHTDSTFLPVPALANILTAKVVPDRGGETALASTRAAWADMPAGLKAQLRSALVWHRYAHSRARISAELARLPMFNKWPDRCWPAIWENPVNGSEALYIASHAFRIEGVDEMESVRIIDAAIAFCTQPDYVYTHSWKVGDVLIWDERATLHRGLPWPYDQPRTLSSICVSVMEQDGLGAMRLASKGFGV